MEIKKIKISDYVMLPRLQHPGLKPKHVECDAFKAELKHVEGHGDYWLLYQQSKPHVVAHVQLPKSEAESLRTSGVSTSREIYRSFVSLPASMPKSSPPSTQIS